MAENRCPMCSKVNPEGADECEFCGARLTPLVVDPSDQGDPDFVESPPQEDDPEEAGEPGTPDWLARIRERAEREIPQEPEPEEEAEEDQLGWLDRMRAAETEQGGAPEGEIPDWMTEQEEDGEGLPESEPEEEGDDWLGRLRDQAGEQVDAAESEPEPAALEPAEEPGAPSEGVEGEPEIAEEPMEEAGELPGWLSDTSVDFDAMEGPPGEAEPPEVPAGPAEEAADWFGDTEEPAEGAFAEEPPIEEQPTPPIDEAAAADEGEEMPSWLDDVEVPEGETGLPSSPAFSAEEEWEFEPEDMPEEAPLPEADVEAEIEPELEAEVEPESEPEIEPEWEREPEPEPQFEEQEPDWEDFAADEVLEEVLDEEAPTSEEPPPEEDELPHVPALAMDADQGPRFEETDDFDLDAIELPDWLSEGRPGEGEGPEAAKEGDLAPATIPTWLEAMRPVETFQQVVEGEPEEDEPVESVGPLAGLRGVLLAEPVVAKPRTATATGARLQVTERQYAQAELLQRIVEEEEQERAVAREQARRIPLVRWLVSVLLLLAVLVPPLTGLPTFATPERVSRDLGPLVETVNAIPAERPVLVVFDYEPGYSAELDGVAGALMEHLFARDMNVVTMSTRPTGPPLALDMVRQVGGHHEVENGRNYLHLGYLSGGPIAVQLFAAAPQQAILRGFMLPTDLGVQSGWEAPILRDVERLSDFSMVAVVASGTDTARQWAEQAHPFMGDTPLVMVLSAGAEPMIRPYFESLDPQVDGILSGLPAAVAYEQINGRLGEANARWDALGAGALAVEGILLAGVAFGAASWYLGRREE